MRLAADVQVERLERVLRTIAEFPPPLENKNSALNQCDYLKQLAADALSAGVSSSEPTKKGK